MPTSWRQSRNRITGKLQRPCRTEHGAAQTLSAAVRYGQLGGLVTRHGDRTLPGQPLGRGPPRRSLPVGLSRTGLPGDAKGRPAARAAASSRGRGRVHCHGDAAPRARSPRSPPRARPPRSRCVRIIQVTAAASRVKSRDRGPGRRRGRPWGPRPSVHTPCLSFCLSRSYWCRARGLLHGLPRGGLPRNCHGWPRTKFRSRMQGAQCRFKMHRFAQSILR